MSDLNDPADPDIVDPDQTGDDGGAAPETPEGQELDPDGSVAAGERGLDPDRDKGDMDAPTHPRTRNGRRERSPSGGDYA